MNDGVEAARKFDNFIGPLMLWGVNNWQVVLVGVLILSLLVALATNVQRVNDRNALAKAIAREARR